MGLQSKIEIGAKSIGARCTSNVHGYEFAKWGVKTLSMYV